jgi:hypothetical protein
MGDIQVWGRRSGPASVVEVVEVVGRVGMLLVVVAMTVVVLLLVVGITKIVVVVVGTGPVVVGTALDVVVGTGPVVVGRALDVVVVLPPPPPLVVDVVGVVGVVVLVEPPGAVVEVWPTTVVVVVVAPVQAQTVQRPPHGPNPPSHSSPPAASQTPSPQKLKLAMNGFAIPDFLAVNVPASVRHCSIIVPFSTAAPVRPGHDFHRTRTLVPFCVPRTRAFAGAQPLCTDTMRPSTVTTSGSGMSGAPVSAVPTTR